jgi:hypothetical protein
MLRLLEPGGFQSRVAGVAVCALLAAVSLRAQQ